MVFCIDFNHEFIFNNIYPMFNDVIWFLVTFDEKNQ